MPAGVRLQARRGWQHAEPPVDVVCRGGESGPNDEGSRPQQDDECERDNEEWPQRHIAALIVNLRVGVASALNHEASPPRRGYS